MTGSLDAKVDVRGLAAFSLLVGLVGANLVAIRLSNRELAPFWNAALRFGISTAGFALVALLRRAPLPRPRVALGAAVYGFLAFAAFFGFIYVGLVHTPVALAQTILALGPLITLAMAVAAGIERPSVRAIGGGLVAVAGIVIVYGFASPAQLPWTAILAVLAAAISFAAAGIVAKRLPQADPVVHNGIAAAVGGSVLLGLSAVAREPWLLPARPETWVALIYLAIPGTIVVFLLFLFLVRRWPASRVAYQFVLAPLVAIGLAALILGESITPAIVVGAAIVVLGVYVGALKSRPA